MDPRPTSSAENAPIISEAARGSIRFNTSALSRVLLFNATADHNFLGWGKREGYH
jgi:hypothetical protein